MEKLFLATSNPGKLAELRLLLGDCGCELVSPEELGITLSGRETGGSYLANATMKAREGAEASRLLTFAEDSGLEIDALDGEPGHLSARYLGEDTGYEERFRMILARLNETVREQRTARFRCVAAIARPEGHDVRSAEGICEGLITEPRGSAGFGYDPMFYIPDLEKTMAELTMEEKNRISHRAAAARAAIPIIRELMAVGRVA